MAQDGHEMLKLLKRHTQEFTIFSRAGLLRMIKVEPFNCNNCFFLVHQYDLNSLEALTRMPHFS